MFNIKIFHFNGGDLKNLIKMENDQSIKKKNTNFFLKYFFRHGGDNKLLPLLPISLLSLLSNSSLSFIRHKVSILLCKSQK